MFYVPWGFWAADSCEFLFTSFLTSLDHRSVTSSPGKLEVGSMLTGLNSHHQKEFIDFSNMLAWQGISARSLSFLDARSLSVCLLTLRERQINQPVQGDEKMTHGASRLSTWHLIPWPQPMIEQSEGHVTCTSRTMRELFIRITSTNLKNLHFVYINNK